MPNDPSSPMISPLGVPYAALWAPQLRDSIELAEDLVAWPMFSMIGPFDDAEDRIVAVDSEGLMPMILNEPTPQIFVHTLFDGARPDPGRVIFVTNKIVLNALRERLPSKAAPSKASATAFSGAASASPQNLNAATGVQGVINIVEPQQSSFAAQAGVNDRNDEDIVMQECDQSPKDAESQGALKPTQNGFVKPATGCSNDANMSAEMSNAGVPMQEAVFDSHPCLVNKVGTSAEIRPLPSASSETAEIDNPANVNVASGSRQGKVRDESPRKSLQEPPFDPKILAELPKLEQFIPEQYFPDTLMVCRDNEEPVEYVRIFPTFDRDGISWEPKRVGRLWLPDLSIIGRGNHSRVRRAPLQMPEPLSAYGRHRLVTVAAKTALCVISARRFLRNEALRFNAFPKRLQQEWCGYNLVTKIRHPVPVGAVVPKFFGYYVPLDANGKPDDKTWQEYDEEDDTEIDGLSPVLLMEECGKPVLPESFTLDERSECYSLMIRLHFAGFLQNSMYTRNIMWQPGPLTKPPKQRSRKTPSFRIIDFGRGEDWDEYKDQDDGKDLEHHTMYIPKHSVLEPPLCFLLDSFMSSEQFAILTTRGFQFRVRFVDVLWAEALAPGFPELINVAYCSEFHIWGRLEHLRADALILIQVSGPQLT
ncbi:hypothetical protein IEO21_07071 [Rhodonia placenta]|uniref:Uncharacterized protein n=1 Tax=Rhodonia placenta TaxID=104341 RepID=A0A8H7NYV1_9APHY|nr:hypothetical protein IEO21_07071 [Postia placenta]